jgi:protein-disulfide isomerase
MRLTHLSLLSLLALAPSGCARSTDAQTPGKPPASQAPGGVVAEVDGAPITFEEMEKRAAKDLYQLRQEEYDTRRQAIEAIVFERLLQKEAKRRGLTVAELTRAEVNDKLKPVTPDEVAATYERAKPRLGGRSLEQVRPDIEAALRQQREAQRRSELRSELLAAAKVQVKLEAPRVPIEIPPNTPVVGPADAPITVIEYSDYQCPYCHKAQESVDQVMAKYAGKVRFVHQEYPLSFHPRAFAASLAARCADEQGKFWDFHRNLMLSPGSFEDDDLQKRATALGLDAGKLQACVASGKYDPVVKAALDAGTAVGVNSTPTFFINGRRVTGALPFETFRQVIDEELARSKAD